jgi:O-antigen/teichoic acid export membrane protein
MVALVTKFAKDDLSNLVIALSVSAPVIVFANLQLRMVQALQAGDNHKFGDFLTLRLAAQFLSFGTLLLWGIFSSYSSELMACLLLVSASRCFYSISETFYGEQQRTERMEGIASSMALKGVASVGVFAFFIFYHDSINVALIAWGAVHLAMIAYDYMQTKKISGDGIKLAPSLNLKSMRVILRKGLPLGMSGLLISLQINIPNYALMASDYIDEVGIFGTLLFMATIGRKIIEAGVRAIGPRLAKILGDKKYSRFRQLRFRLTALASAIGILGLIVSLTFGGNILEIIYTSEFAPYQKVLTWIILGETLNFASLALEHALSAGSRYSAQLKSISASLVGLILASLIFIPEYGVLGAAWAIVAGGLARLIATATLTRKFDATIHA